MRAGKAKVLAVAAGQRAAIFPSVPTTQRIYDAVAKALNDPANLKFLTDQGLDVLGSTPADFRRFVVSENAKFGKAAAAAGIKPE